MPPVSETRTSADVPVPEDADSVKASADFLSFPDFSPSHAFV